MNNQFNKIAAALSMIIGILAVVAGGRVLMGTLPDYYVINWLPIYNFIIGLVTVLVTAPLIWKNSKYALPAAIATFSAHLLVMFILLSGYRSVIATDSIMAMTLRLVTWLIILTLMYLGTRKRKVLTI
jgi:hypothetical protein